MSYSRLANPSPCRFLSCLGCAVCARATSRLHIISRIGAKHYFSACWKPTAGWIQSSPSRKTSMKRACGYFDVQFVTAETGKIVNEQQICSVGLMFRDYETLLAAVAELPFVKLKI